MILGDVFLIGGDEVFFVDVYIGFRLYFFNICFCGECFCGFGNYKVVDWGVCF